MARKQRSRSKAKNQTRTQPKAAVVPVASPEVMAPPRSPAKLRAKIRLRVAQMPSASVNDTVDLEDAGTWMPAEEPRAHRALPKARAELGTRLPLFRPAVYIDSGPDWDGREDAAKTKAPISRRGVLITGLSLVLLTAIVATVAVLPPTARIIPTKAEAAQPLGTPSVPASLLEKFDHYLRTDSLDQKIAMTHEADRWHPVMESFYLDYPVVPAWLPQYPLSTLPNSWEPRASSREGGLMTLWVNERFPVSVVVYGDLLDPRFDWRSLMGVGQQSLCQFFRERPTSSVELRVLASAVLPSAGRWHLNKEDHLRVRLSDLEGLIKGIAYVSRNDLPPWASDILQGEMDTRSRVTIRAHYTSTSDPDIRVPVITAWLAQDWQGESTEVAL